AALGPGYGAPVALTRGALRWRMAVPQSGKLPFSNSAPALIEWETDPPHAALTDRGCRLRQLCVRHPEAEALAATLAPFLSDPRVVFEAGTPGLQARIDTPHGPRVIA
ncbi:MAG: VOC family protein, partial [Pseudomonadota bacterium]